MTTIKYILLVVLFNPLFFLAQSDTSKKQYLYIVCEEFKTDCGKGSIISNVQKPKKDASILCYVNCEIVNSENQDISFASIIFINKKTNKTFSSSTDLDGKLKILLEQGDYSIKTTYFGYISYTIDSLNLEKGDIRSLKINIGEYCCLKTKVISSDKPLDNSVYIETKKE